jgi:leucyl/phenylalanyl-tRNA--protein transferase
VKSPPHDVPWVPPDTGPPDGLIGVGGSLDPLTLLRAYAEGVFPWYGVNDPILWWSPDPRAVLPLDDRFHVPRRLARTIASGKFRVTFDTCFRTVMQECGKFRDEGSWIQPEMVAAYTVLHEMGFAHSVETWLGDDLVGGVYGVAVGSLFAGESMFYRAADASKVALVALHCRLMERGYELFDSQIANDHTTRFGAIEVPRGEYLLRARQAVRNTRVTFR